MTIAERFAANLATTRKRAGLSQEELGVRASLHRTEISQLERGLRVARIDTLVKLAGGLGVEATDLLAGIEWAPGATVYGSFEVRPQPKSEVPPELPRGRRRGS